MNKKKPNILLLFTDQQRFDTINACGFSYVKTPNLDRLVKEGVVFTNAYTSNPVCIPARHNVLTGFYARQHGYADNSNMPFTHLLPTIPRILSDNCTRQEQSVKCIFVHHAGTMDLIKWS